jgi:hypothetical protein
MRLMLAARRFLGTISRQRRFALVLTGIAFACSGTGLSVRADPVSTMDRLHFSLNEAEPSFADGGPAFVSPATAVTGLNAPTIREAFLRRELTRIEESVTDLALRRVENPDDREVAQKLDSMRKLADRLRRELGLSTAHNRQTPSPTPQVPRDARVAMSGDDNHLLLRLRPAVASAGSVAIRNLDGDESGQVVIGTQAFEFQPSARTTVGLFGRSHVGEAWTSDQLSRAISAGWSAGAASSVELDRNYIFSAAMLYGRSWTQAEADDANAGFSGDEFVADARLDNRSWYGSWLFAPAIAAHYEQAMRGSYTDDEGTHAGAEGRRLGRLSATNEISRSFVDLSSERIVTYHPFIRAGASLDLEPDASSEIVSLSEMAAASASVGGGLRVYSGRKSSLMLSEEYTHDGEEGTFRFITQVETPFGIHENGEQLGTLNLSADADQTGTVNARMKAILRFD